MPPVFTRQEGTNMHSSDTLSRQGHHMLQIGVALFVFSALEGFAIPFLPVPRLSLLAT